MSNNKAPVRFVKINSENYKSKENKDENTFYYIKDSGELYLGDTLIGDSLREVSELISYDFFESIYK